ncbi:synaptotagmin-like protein 2 isoform X3 [Parambassis ranga]|uniref:Synaptotagmin-like protein 2 n=1 Tax=Parambassis ranga TaxID=210632 RepID=A0A6P7JLH2_9TELE|nr:synaptotagmin-like protein 2 isoform X3 [Parambassis ranga]
MIDLSFLTEEEQEAILTVLKRDAELKKAEEQRVQNLQQTVGDKSQLRYLTGEWFYETKQLRHQEHIHGSDIIRASLRRTQKPLTLLELSHILPENSSFVGSENKEVFIPPELCGLLQEPHLQLHSEGYQSPYQSLEDTPKPILPSPTKRTNPFNRKPAFAEEDSGLVAKAAQTQTSNQEIIPSPETRQATNDTPISQNASVSMPMCENSSISQDSFLEVDVSGGKQTKVAAPRGILKHLSASSSTDSLPSCLEPQYPCSLDCPTDTWIDRKQVRFSTAVSQSGVKWQDGKEVGEHSLLDTDSSTPENASDLEKAGSSPAGTHEPSLKHSQVDSQEGEPGCKYEANIQEQEAGQHLVFGDVSELFRSALPSSALSTLVSANQEVGNQEAQPGDDCQSQDTDQAARHSIHPAEALSGTKQSTTGSSKTSHSVSPKPRQRLLGIFSREKDKAAPQQGPQKEETSVFNQGEPYNTQNLSKGVADLTVDKPQSNIKEIKPPQTTEVKTLQLLAMQTTPFKDTMNSDAADTCQSSGDKREGARHEDGAKMASYGIPTNTVVKDMNSNLSPLIETPDEDPDSRFQEKSLSPQGHSRLSEDLLENDGTYRANPVLICEETDDSLSGSVTELQSSEPQESIISPVAFDTHKSEENIIVPLSQQSSSSPTEDRPAKISELKHFWEKEYTGPKVVTTRVREASSTSVLTNKAASLHSDVRASLESTEKSEREAQTSPYKTKKSLTVTDKGFVSQSPEKSQLKSSGNSVDVQSTSVQLQMKADVESQERPLSTTIPHPPRSKDQDDEVKRSPSKTCHPKVLPRESSISKGSSLERSPLKTFPIDINPQTNASEEQQVKPTPVPRQRKSPLHGAKETDANLSTDTTSPVLLSHQVDRGAFLGHLATQNNLTSPASPQSKEEKKKFGPFTRLARSFIPQDSQHYLGPQEKAHIPHFNPDRPADGNPDKNSIQDSTTKAWSLSWAGSGSYDDSSTPVLSALKRLSSRSVSSSKSLENLTSPTKEERTQSNSREQINRSVDDVSSLPPSTSTLNSKTSMSVPVLQQDETDSDSALDTNVRYRRNTSSSTSTLSLSSGMASMSSVSGSMSSIYPADFGDIEVQGSIQFAVNYIQKLGEFHIFVVLCRDLAIADTKKNRSDPYVKCYLLPDKTKLGKRKTNVKKKTLNPTYNEILRFKITMEVLKTQNLNISVWHNDTFGRNSYLGEVDLDLSEWDFNNTQINEYALKANVSAQKPAPSPSRLMGSRGQMKVALRFLPQTTHSTTVSRMETGEVQIWVKDCKNLPPVRGVIIDPFVKCTVLPDTSRKSRQKTRVVKRTANPMFNHTMVYDGFRAEDLREACVEITVWDHDRLNNHYIGGLRLGLGTGKSYGVDVLWMDSTTDEASLWQRMLQSTGEWVEDVLPLRMLEVAKNTSK